MSGKVFWDRDTIRFMIDASENSTDNMEVQVKG